MSHEHVLDEEQLALVEAVREFSQGRRSVSAKATRKSFPYQIVWKWANGSIWPIPEEYGGQGGDYFTLCLLLRQAKSTSR